VMMNAENPNRLFCQSSLLVKTIFPTLADGSEILTE